MTGFRVHVSPSTGALVAAGELDIAEVDGLLAEARAQLDVVPDHLELDLQDVTFIDSTGIGALVRLRNEAMSAGKPLVLTSVPPAVTRLFEITGLTDVFASRAGD